jgi:hypothetical protein
MNNFLSSPYFIDAVSGQQFRVPSPVPAACFSSHGSLVTSHAIYSAILNLKSAIYYCLLPVAFYLFPFRIPKSALRIFFVPSAFVPFSIACCLSPQPVFY